MAKLTVDQLYKRKVRSRTSKEAIQDEAEATHVVSIVIPGAFTNVDRDILQAAGGFSDFSGCDILTGNRDHAWYVKGEKAAKEMKENLKTMLKELDRLNGRKLGGKVTVVRK